ncbi:MAG TPA: iron-sulfur cluster assembly protein [Anaerolineales bacterium]|nr:iron-sulfur cluster assembly protein [Anaerolineales bacterium]
MSEETTKPVSDETTPSKTIWEADSTHPQLADSVRTALREVVDPEIGLNVIELGLIRDLNIAEGEAHMKMILTTPFCPYGPAMLEMARSKAEQAAGMPTRIELGMDMWDPSLMEEGAGAAWGLF